MGEIIEVARYQGRDYCPTLNRDGTVNLLSSDPTDLERGFQVLRPGRFMKIVARDEVEEAYRVFRYGVLHGHRFPVLAEKDGRFLLGDGGQGGWAVELGFEQVSRLEFEKWVRPEELDRMDEKKEPIW